MIEVAVVTDDLLVSTTNVVSIGATIPLVPVDRVPITVLLGNVRLPSVPKVQFDVVSLLVLNMIGF